MKKRASPRSAIACAFPSGVMGTTLDHTQAGGVFKRDRPLTWRCRNGLYLLVGTSAPERCPACLYPQAHFKLLGEKW